MREHVRAGISENAPNKRDACGKRRAAVWIGIVAFLTIPAIAQSLQNPGTSSLAASPAARQTASGKELFRQHCASCHYAETTAQKIGPGLKGLYGRAFASGKKVSDAALAVWIENGGKDMPGFKDMVRTEQVRALISYIKTL